MSEKRFRITTLPKSNAVAFDEKQKKHYIGIDFENLLNDQQATINNQKQRIKILQQEIKDTQAVLEMQSEKLKGWDDDTFWIRKHY